MEKRFREMQGRHSSSGARGREMARRGVELTLAVDKWDMVWGAMSWGWAGWGAERAHGICAPFHLFRCENGRNGNSDIVSGDARESRLEVVERGFPRISARGYIIISKVKIYY